MYEFCSEAKLLNFTQSVVTKIVEVKSESALFSRLDGDIGPVSV